MSLLFSRHCEYALQSVLYLATKPQGNKTSIRELNRALGIPYHFLGKILQDLSRKGILVSRKGATGGFGLRKSAAEITLFEIVEAIDGTSFLQTCVLGFPECSGLHPCAVHGEWGGMREDIHAMLVNKTIDEMAAGMHKPAYRRPKKS